RQIGEPVVVEADDRDVTGDPVAGTGQGVQESDRAAIVERGDGGGERLLVQQCLRGPDAVVLGEAATYDQAVPVQPGPGHGAAVATPPVGGGRGRPPVDVRDLAVAQAEEVLHGLMHAPGVVGADDVDPGDANPSGDHDGRRGAVQTTQGGGG